MIGAIIGDIVGSRFEWNNYKAKDFELFTDECMPTDDSIMTIALAKAIMESRDEDGNYDIDGLGAGAVRCMQGIGRKYPDCGYGGFFYDWIFDDDPQPYGSFGNGAAMRVSAAGFAAGSLEEAKALAKAITEVTHDHPEGLKGAEATAVAIFMARHGASQDEIENYINEHYYDIDFTLDDIRDTYEFDETCQNTVPQALEAFFEADSFEDAIRNAISIGGDSDTLAAITGGIAEAYFGVPDELAEQAMGFLDLELAGIVYEWMETIAGDRA